MLFTSLIITSGTLGVFYYYDPFNTLQLAQTMAFTTLVVFELFQALNCRSIKLSLFKVGVFSNKYLIGAILSSVALQAILLYTPLNKIFGVVPLGLKEWGVVVLVASSVLIIRELIKLFNHSNGQ